MAPQMAPRDELHPLHAAAAAGSVAEVRRLLQQVPHQVTNAPPARRGGPRSAIFFLGRALRVFTIRARAASRVECRPLALAASDCERASE